jgi:hypothetical protein
MVSFLYRMFTAPLALVACFLVVQSSAYAITSIDASVDKNPAFVNEIIVLTVVANESLPQQALDLQPLETDFLVGTPSMINQEQRVNNERTVRTIWQIPLQAKREGKLQIPPLALENLQTKAISIEILPATKTAGSSNAELAFVETILSADQVYVQQLFYIDVKIYLMGDLQSGHINEPVIADATIERLGSDEEGSEIVNGERYQTFTRRYSVVVNKPGTFNIDKVSFEGEVINHNKRTDFWARGTQVMIQAPKVTLNVAPLPPTAPTPWLVSELVTLTEEWSNPSQSPVEGEPITRTITLTAIDVQKNQLPDLDVMLPPDFKAYAEQPQAGSAVRNGHVVSQKTFTTAIIATKAGDFVLPEVNVQWWNSKTNTMEIASLPARTISVQPSADQSANSAATPTTTASEQASAVSNDALASSQPTSSTPSLPHVNAASFTMWSLLVALLLIVWLATLAYVFYLRRTITKLLQADDPLSSLEPPRFNSKKLRTACLQNNSQQAKAELLLWARQHFQRPVAHLTELLTLLPAGDLQQHIQQLSFSGYQRDAQPWQGHALFECWVKFRHLHAKPSDLDHKSAISTPSSSQNGGLKPLYPR